jgi:cobalamin-dependent methionine synthase I
MPVVEIQPRLNDGDLAKLLGNGQNKRYSNAVRSKIRVWKKRLYALIKPRLVYHTEKIRKNGKHSVQLEDEVAFKSLKLSSALDDSERVVCFVGTIGTAVEREINKLLSQNHLADAYILDAMGSVAVEDMVEQFQQGMEATCSENDKTVTLRFSPGYCDWPLTEQKKLFSVCDSEKIGVQLLDSCLMSPRKSISGVFGIAPQGSIPYNPCLDCSKKNCEARRC